MFKVILCFVFYISILNIAHASYAIQQSEESFATAVVLTDNDTISLGVGNFNPDALLKLNDPNLSEHLLEGESIDLRNQLKVYSIPYTFKLNQHNKEWSDSITFHAAYIEQESRNYFPGETDLVPDDNIDKTYSGYLAYSKHLSITKNMRLRLRIGGYIMHHENIYRYNNDKSKSIKPFVDGEIFNTTANAAIIEPNVKLTYTKIKDWGKWAISSDINYFTGKVYSGSESNVGAKPNGWRINNGVKVHFDVNKGNSFTESLYMKFQRIDIKGDMVTTLKTSHFYEVGIGALIDIRSLTDLVDNIGVGLNINKGSSLSGGSIVFYINEF